MTIPAQVDVLVTGLGPAGAATAARLARAGLKVLAIDRAEFPRDKACSEYLSPETLRQLQALGVLQRAEAAGAAPLRGVTVHGPRGSRLTGLFAQAGVAPFRATGMSIARRVLDQLLVQAAREAGVTVLERSVLVGLRYERGAVAGAVFRRDGALHDVRSRALVGADGLHSLTARLIGGRRYGFPSRYGFVAHVADVQGMTETAELHVGDEGYAGLNAIGGGLTNVAVVVPARRAREAVGDAEGFWHQALEQFPEIRGRVRRDGVARRVLVTGPFAARSARVVAGGSLLVGDAADFFDPFTGEGICTALRGAHFAADTLVEALATPGIPRAAQLAPYRAARRRAFAGKWALERLIGFGMLTPRLFDRAVGRLERRGLAHTLIGVTGQFVPASAVLRPGFLAAMMV